ncbi:hypothetical protein OUZ56_004390 [Daphnia magna]|uniref:Uncharacterized protein n=1 Tax=Daphnia magna TaxID=35525 RepID=A0ABQ9YPT7_9CRUS|nr:hypothetical protein OUZ56_004390 [Daphnia magna]
MEYSSNFSKFNSPPELTHHRNKNRNDEGIQVDFWSLHFPSLRIGMNARATDVSTSNTTGRRAGFRSPFSAITVEVQPADGLRPSVKVFSNRPSVSPIDFECRQYSVFDGPSPPPPFSWLNARYSPPRFSALMYSSPPADHLTENRGEKKTLNASGHECSPRQGAAAGPLPYRFLQEIKHLVKESQQGPHPVTWFWRLYMSSVYLVEREWNTKWENATPPPKQREQECS